MLCIYFEYFMVTFLIYSWSKCLKDMKLIQNSATEDNRKQRISQERYLREKEKAKGKEILQIICSKHYGSLVFSFIYKL